MVDSVVVGLILCCFLLLGHGVLPCFAMVVRLPGWMASVNRTRHGGSGVPGRGTGPDERSWRHGAGSCLHSNIGRCNNTGCCRSGRHHGIFRSDNGLRNNIGRCSNRHLRRSCRATWCKPHVRRRLMNGIRRPHRRGPHRKPANQWRSMEGEAGRIDDSVSSCVQDSPGCQWVTIGSSPQSVHGVMLVLPWAFRATFTTSITTGGTARGAANRRQSVNNRWEVFRKRPRVS